MQFGRSSSALEMERSPKSGIPTVWHYLADYKPKPTERSDGLNKAVAGLAEWCRGPGLDSTIITESEDGMFGEVSSPRVLGFRPTRAKWYSYQNPRLVAFLESVAQRQAAGEVHLFVLNGIFHHGVCHVARHLNRARLPYVVAPHDPFHPSIFGKNRALKTIYWQFFEKPLLKRACAIQLLDIRHAAFLHQLGVKTPTFALPNGLHACQIPSSTRPFSAPAENVRLLFLGRLDAYNKGLDLLISAMSMIRDLPICLTLQGPDWGDRQSLQRMIDEYGLRERIQIVPPDFERTSIEVISQHDVFCIPSRFEGFSIAALEAIAAGRPVLVSNVAGIAPYISRFGNGIVVQSDVEALASGLRNILKQRSEWPVMAESGRDGLNRELLWPRIGAMAAEIYRKLCANAKTV